MPMQLKLYIQYFLNALFNIYSIDVCSTSSIALYINDSHVVALK